LVIQSTADTTTVTSAMMVDWKAMEIWQSYRQRNFNRIKTNSFANKKGRKKVCSSFAKSTGLSIDFSTLIPNTGLLGGETTI
jgi:hypothetical protein